jgi:predicted RNase H-like HicB family nuclease
MNNNSKQIYNYTVILEKEEHGGYHAFCPILKGCHSQGDTFEETIDNITEAIELYLESLKMESRFEGFHSIIPEILVGKAFQGYSGLLPNNSI